MSKTTSTTAAEPMSVVETYRRAGWPTPFPLPAGEKFPPVTGCTGEAPSVEAAARAAEAAWNEITNGQARNTGLRMPADVIVLDVDDYEKKHGAAALAELIEKLGALPPTYSSTRRGADSPARQLFFRVPAGVKWSSAAGPGIDILQHTHRYAVVWPSVVDGDMYRWYDVDGKVMPEREIPNVEDLPELPEAWVKALTSGVAAPALKVQDLSLDAAVEWLATHSPNGVDVFTYDDGGRRVALPPERNFSAEIAETLAKPDLFAGNAHPEMTAIVWRWVHDAVRYGSQNVMAALERLSELYVQAVTDRRSETVADGEFARSLSGAVAKVRAKIEAGEYRPILDYWPEMFDPEVSVSFGRVDGTDRLGFIYRPVTAESDSADSGPEDRPRAKKGLALRSFDELETIEPAWLWEFDGVGGVPLGGLTVFTGRGGVGKSTACRWLAAEVTRGTLPGEFHGTAHSVLYIAAEESNSAMVKPSLVAHGAVEERVFFTEIDGEANRVDPAYMAELTALCKANDVRLVVVDPMSNFLHGANMNAASEVRDALRPWTVLAEEIDGAVVAIFHQNKSGSSDIVHGVGGSAAIGEVARSLFGFARDTDSGECVMSQGKNNLGPFMPDLAYTLEAVNLEGRKNPGVRFHLGEVSAVSVGEIQIRNKQTAAGEKETAKSWLREHLRGLSAPALKSDVVAAGAAAGFSTRSVEDAAKKLGVKSSRHDRKAMWSLD